MATSPDEMTQKEKNKNCFCCIGIVIGAIVFFIFAQFVYPNSRAKSHRQGCYDSCYLEHKLYLDGCKRNCDEEADEIKNNSRLFTMIGNFIGVDER